MQEKELITKKIPVVRYLIQSSLMQEQALYLKVDLQQQHRVLMEPLLVTDSLSRARMAVCITYLVLLVVQENLMHLCSIQRS